MTNAPLFRVTEVDLFEEPVRYRMPFRFGAATVSEGAQAFVRARIRLADGREVEGASAELMVPKWFDKNPALSIDDTIGELRHALSIAREAYTADATPRSAFGHYAAHARDCIDEGARHGLPELAAGFGPAEIDKAVLDALCRALGVSFFEAVSKDAIGFEPASIAPDLAGADARAFVASMKRRDSLLVRHTVGIADMLRGHPARVRDGLPESLEEAIARYGLRWFKVKLGGDVDADLSRLRDIAGVLDALPAYGVTLDGNEQYAPDALESLVQALFDGSIPRRLARAIAFIEQPLPRADTFEVAVPPDIPMLVDEADGTLDAFPRARSQGYTGVSSKGCKGLYKSLVNALRCATWGAPYFLSAEDLTTPAGLAFDQDVATACLLGVTHIERNGYHYLGGASAGRIQRGAISTDALAGIGFASDAPPDWRALAPMRADTLTELTEQ